MGQKYNTRCNDRVEKKATPFPQKKKRDREGERKDEHEEAQLNPESRFPLKQQQVSFCGGKEREHERKREAKGIARSRGGDFWNWIAMGEGQRG